MMHFTARMTKFLIAGVLVCLVVDTFLFALLISNEVGRSVTAGVFAGLLGALQWLVGLTRERERSTWEAIQAYYTEGDSSAILTVRHKIRDGTATDAEKAAFVNFYEKWGRLVQYGYLPLDIFNGPSGSSLLSLHEQLTTFIADQKSRNPRYSQSYGWLLSRIQDTLRVRS
jgi:hypothetical protein